MVSGLAVWSGAVSMTAFRVTPALSGAASATQFPSAHMQPLAGWCSASVQAQTARGLSAGTFDDGKADVAHWFSDGFAGEACQQHAPRFVADMA